MHEVVRLTRREMPGPPTRAVASLVPGTLVVATLGLAILVALGVWQGQGYWEYSDGVYSLTARLILEGRELYREVAGAQPPTLFYLAAGVLAVDDSPTAIRVAMAGYKAATAVLVGVAVWRLTRRRDAAGGAALLSMVTPWSLREHGQLLPETIAAPLVMACALAASRPATSWVAGALGAVAVTLKLAFVLPALTVVLVARDVRRGSVAFIVTALLLAVGFGAAFGAPLWDNIVRAQADAGFASLRYVAGLWAQGGWNLLPLAVPAVLAWSHRARLEDPALTRALLGALVGALALLGTLLKEGSYLTVLVVVEPLLVCFAACGFVAVLERCGADATAAWRLRAATLGAVGVLGAGQAVSLLASPADPELFTRPLAGSGPARVLSDEEVTARVEAIRACPPGTVYAGPPYLAFVAGVGIAGSQPDRFIIQASPVLADFRAAADGDGPVCP